MVANSQKHSVTLLESTGDSEPPIWRRGERHLHGSGNGTNSGLLSSFNVCFFVGGVMNLLWAALIAFLFWLRRRCSMAM